jgi:hypothetical protein
MPRTRNKVDISDSSQTFIKNIYTKKKERCLHHSGQILRRGLCQRGVFTVSFNRKGTSSLNTNLDKVNRQKPDSSLQNFSFYKTMNNHLKNEGLMHPTGHYMDTDKKKGAGQIFNSLILLASPRGFEPLLPA